MADKSVEIKITGLKELAAAFKQIDRDLPKHLRTRFKVVADTIVGKAQQRMPFITGSAAHDLKPVAGATYAGISRPGGGPGSTSHYPWLDFGGTTGRGHQMGPGQGAIKRMMPKGGRYLYPAISESTQIIIKAADEAMADTCAEADLHTQGSNP